MSKPPKVSGCNGSLINGKVYLKSRINPPLPDESSPTNNPTKIVNEKKKYKNLLIFEICIYLNV
jgi:hypothetical protein